MSAVSNDVSLDGRDSGLLYHCMPLSKNILDRGGNGVDGCQCRVSASYNIYIAVKNSVCNLSVICDGRFKPVLRPELVHRRSCADKLHVRGRHQHLSGIDVHQFLPVSFYCTYADYSLRYNLIVQDSFDFLLGCVVILLRIGVMD